MEMENLIKVLAIVRDLFAIVGIGLALWRIFIMRNTFFSDHDRSRRTKSIDLIQFWASNLTKQSSIARKLVESFTAEQCKSLAEGKSFNIDSTKKDLIVELFPQYDSGNNQILSLNEVQSSILRWEVVNYLNNLESVLSAWKHNVADKVILEEQFTYLYNPKENHTIVENFRIALEIDTYPGIKEFIDHLKNNLKSNVIKGKSKI
jgi:hypothetical protein